MNIFRADFHTHTVLSPCGDLEMSPANIIKAALKSGIDIIGITDHNSTRNALATKRLGEKEGVFVLTGAEVNTREEIHCLAFFEFENELDDFQQWLDEHITRIPNSPLKFGDQVVVDEEENIIDQVDCLLIMALSRDIDQVEKHVHSLGGLFIPAHIDAPANGILSQLGFFPPGLKCDAIEISSHADLENLSADYPVLRERSVIRSSDSHFPDAVGKRFTELLLKERSFSEIRMALHGERGRKVMPA